VDVVAQLTKQGFVFVFDRVTGKPVWPIEERAVPASDVAGEHASPTQPFPTRPPAIAPQGISPDEAFDLTPELKAQAQAEMRKYRTGPLYTPPSVEGTLMNPGIIGGANWGGSAFDPATGRLYVKTSNQPALARIRPPDRSVANARAAEVDADLIGAVGNATFTPVPPPGSPGPGGWDRCRWSSRRMGSWWRWISGAARSPGACPFGDTPSVRAHPLLRDVKLPDRLGAAGAPGVIVTRSGLVLGGGGDAALYAFDARTGRELARLELARRGNGTPMTYRARSGRQYIVMATGGGGNAALVAWTLKPGLLFPR
jgi:quinoprotein glucose dehydrogenase